MDKVRVERVAIVTNVIPLYRKDFYDRIIADGEMAVTVYCQDCISGMNLVLAHDNWPGHVFTVPVWSARKERLAWQFLPYKALYHEYDIVIFYGNPRVLSNLVWATIFRILGKKVVIWGQVHTAGASGMSERLRLAWWRMFKYFFVYNDAEVKKLKTIGFDQKLVVSMNNGLNQDEIEAAMAKWPRERLEKWISAEELRGRTIILSCARLEKKNKFHVVIDALRLLKKQFPNVLWCLIGDGPEGAYIKSYAAERGVSEYIYCRGALYEEEELAPWFMSSAFFVHPAGVGLSLLHAFGYGLPVITNDNVEQHMPEYSCLKPDVNGFQFSDGDISSLTDRMERLLSDPGLREKMSRGAYSEARIHCNTSVMAFRFRDLVRQVAS